MTVQLRVGPLIGTLRAVEYHWIWYARNWRATVISSFLQPVLFLVALGFGFGSQVRPSAATGGLAYVVFLVPALLVVTAVQIASWESTYSILNSFKWEQNYWAVIATPVTPGQILCGQLVWGALRLLGSTTIFLAVAAVLGAVPGPGGVLAVPVAVLAGMAFSAPVMAWSATKDSAEGFAGLFRFVILPMTLFTGAFFPVSQLPDWVQPLAWLTPVWQGIELARGVAFGSLDPLPALGHTGYLVALLSVGVLLGRRSFRRRLAV
ncbi:MAG TPA: ABC transporter permease [Actinophytocola sp.]|uniref:ABC transporter permease n=1 Tax=Actinophytocola sp. TaxID=1872138 RepID=UPI002DDD2CCC|nr:ABC transporter permease [Actinophytocola sp.]HEV2783860.1 ABC transporter permease [Actinophytocola sp.]